MAKNSELDKSAYLLKASVEEVAIAESSGGVSSGIPANWRDIENISQSHHFTVQISDINANYDLGSDSFGTFLPVQSMSFNYENFNALSLPVGIYGNLPILKTKSVGKITLNLYDNDRDQLESEIRYWEMACFPDDKYVGYLSDIKRTLIYTSYTVTGKINDRIRIEVIPADNYSVNRGYEENAPKIVTLSLVVVGMYLFG